MAVAAAAARRWPHYKCGAIYLIEPSGAARLEFRSLHIFLSCHAGPNVCAIANVWKASRRRARIWRCITRFIPTGCNVYSIRPTDGSSARYGERGRYEAAGLRGEIEIFCHLEPVLIRECCCARPSHFAGSGRFSCYCSRIGKKKTRNTLIWLWNHGA